MNLLTPLLGRMESAPVMEMMTKEVVGINAPKIAITRSNDERVDVATSRSSPAKLEPTSRRSSSPPRRHAISTGWSHGMIDADREAR